MASKHITVIFTTEEAKSVVEMIRFADRFRGHSHKITTPARRVLRKLAAKLRILERESRNENPTVHGQA